MTFEQTARARKVARIMAVVPHGRNAQELATVAAWLARMTVAERTALAAYAGALPPSDETWRAVVASAFARKRSHKSVTHFYGQMEVA